MFCANCGKQIGAGAAFCPFCGVKTGEPPHSQDSTTTGAAAGPVSSLPAGSLPPNVIEELKKYPKTTTTTCFECGYHGLVGVGNEFISKRDLRISRVLRIVATLMSLVYVAWGFLVGNTSLWFDIIFLAFIFWGLIGWKGRHTQNFLHCPNCKTTLGPVKI